MKLPNSDNVFTGSIPQKYEKYLVPLIFEAYAEDLSRRVVALDCSQVLELAAGTGVVTRHLATSLPSGTKIVATDLNQTMLDHAAAIGTSHPVEWRQADALRLPFPDQSFDVVVCQFGVMFFPDKAKAFSEARRVLRPGGTLFFNVWDRIENNEFADTIITALATLFPVDPPRFLARVPHGYHDLAAIADDLVRGGLVRSPEMITLPARSRADSPGIPAAAYCQGTPLRSEIEVQGTLSVSDATDFAAAAIANRFGPGLVDGLIQAHVVAIQR